MKKILVVLLFVMGLISGSIAAEIVKVAKEVKNFDSISLDYPGIVYLKQGDTESLTMEAEDSVIKKIDINIKGNTLLIGGKGWWNRWFCTAASRNDVIFRITMKSFNEISASGLNTINIETPIKAENLMINISGHETLKSTEDIIVNNELSIDCPGHTELEFKKLIASSLNIDISGSGDIKIFSGNVNKQKVEISGSGEYIASELKTKETDIVCYGSGNLEVNAADLLKAKITGSGNIVYCGEPKKIEQEIFGSGTIQRSSK